MNFIYSTILIFGSAFLLNGISAQTNSNVSAVLISVPEIVMPAEAIASGIGGVMYINVRVDRQGNVSKIDSIQGPGDICFNYESKELNALRSAAENAAKQAKFSPAQKKGKPVNSTIKLTFEFPTTAKQNDSRSNQISKGIVNKDAKFFPAPSYPNEAKTRRATGQVRVNIVIDKNGNVYSAKAESGHELLLYAAVDAACRAKFDKTLVNGVEVTVSGSLAYNFVLGW